MPADTGLRGTVTRSASPQAIARASATVTSVPPSLEDELWRDPAHAVSGLLHVISANLGGDLVVWATADADSGVLTIVDLADPMASTQVLSDLIRHGSAISPTALSSQVTDSNQPMLIPRVDGADCSFDALPQPWLAHLAAHPICGLIGVPIRLDDAVTGVLFAARRTTAMHYTADDLQFVESGTGTVSPSKLRSNEWLIDAALPTILLLLGFAILPDAFKAVLTGFRK